MELKTIQKVPQQMELKGSTINGTKYSSKGFTVNGAKNSSKGSTVNGTKKFHTKWN